MISYLLVTIKDFLFLSIDISTCVCQDCDVEIFPNFYIQKKKNFFTIESIRNDKFIYLNGNQVLDQNLLIDFDQQLVHNSVSFEGYTNAYNSKIQVITRRRNQSFLSVSNTKDGVSARHLIFNMHLNLTHLSFLRTLLNEKYFQMTWLLLNIVKFIFMTTNNKFMPIPMSVRDVDECNNYFLTYKSELYKNFVGFWMEHRRFTQHCDLVTCSKVFIVDGHQKASRLICQYKDVFDNTISELGPVQVGCLFSPLRKGKSLIYSVVQKQLNSVVCQSYLTSIAPNIDHRFCQHHQPPTIASSTTHQIIDENKETNLDKLALIQYIDKDGRYGDARCNVFNG